MKKSALIKVIAAVLIMALFVALLPSQVIAQDDLELVRATEKVLYTETFSKLQSAHGSLYAILSTKGEGFLRITTDPEGTSVVPSGTVPDGRLYELENVESLWPAITSWQHTLRVKLTVDGQTLYFWQQPGDGLTVYYYAERPAYIPALPGYVRLSDVILYTYLYDQLLQQHEQMYVYLSGEMDEFVRVTTDPEGSDVLRGGIEDGLYLLEGVESLWPAMTLWQHTLRLTVTVDGQTLYFWRRAGSGQTVYVADAVTEQPAPEPTSSLLALETLQTVLFGSTLRAESYAVMPVDATVYGTQLKYFSATMYNYHTAEINGATKALEYGLYSEVEDWERWNGLYFTYGNPTWDWQYADANLSGVYTPPDYEPAGTLPNDLSWDQEGPRLDKWQVEHTGGKPVYVELGKDISITVGETTYNLKQGEYYEIPWIQQDKIHFRYQPDGGGESIELAYTNYYYAQDESIDANTEPGIQVYTIASVEHSFAAWNYGAGGFRSTAGSRELTPGEGDLLALLNENIKADGNDATETHPNALSLTGLIKDQLDANKNIQFNIPQAGIFNGKTDDTKTVYTNVGIPFVYDPDTKTYTLDSHQFSVTSDGELKSGENLVYDPTPQTLSKRMYNAQGQLEEKYTTETSWYPFNTGKVLYAKYSGEDKTDFSKDAEIPGELADFHFGMQITIPFTITPDGKLIQGDKNSDDIEFSFTGDDDVWIFIDGVLVGDLSGIHEKAGVTFNFAQNTVTYEHQGVDVALDANGNLIEGSKWLNNSKEGADSEDETKKPTQLYLFNSGENTKGALDMTRETFAASGEHELTIFYLERGATYSNIKIEFNLPMHDYVSVSKDVQVADKEDATPENIDNVEFNFALFEQRNGSEAAPLANTYYSILNRNGQLVGTGVTDVNGRFQLKNGQTARFQVTIGKDNGGDTTAESVTYFVQEEVDDAVFAVPQFSYDGRAANGFTWGANLPETEGGTEDSSGDDANKKWAPGTQGSKVTLADINKHYGASIEDNESYYGLYQSYSITVQGTLESEDSLHFYCTNTLKDLPVLSPDMIVIDYGLPVEIDVLANDAFWSNTSRELSLFCTNEACKHENGVHVTSFGTAKVNNVNGVDKIVYTLTKQMTQVEMIRYRVTVTNGNETEERTSYVFITPATIMYYEEDFPGLITSGGSVSAEGNAQTDPQEPGVVGTVGDSVYGSDQAYMKDDDGQDSNGTSLMFNVSTSAAYFTYTFQGTGTTFFTRTDADAATMRVRIYQPLEVENGEYTVPTYAIRDKNNNNEPVLKLTYGADGTTVIAAEVLIYEHMRDNRYIDKDNLVTQEINTLYNIPVFTWQTSDVAGDDPGYGTYRVEVALAKKSNACPGSTLFLDGIRIINPLEPDSLYEVEIGQLSYGIDGESAMVYETLRDKILPEDALNGNFKELWDGQFVIFTDSKGEIVSAEEYKHIGPKEEVYLYNGQSVSFFLKDYDPDLQMINLGIKAPSGAGTVTINGKTINIKNATDCYYDISQYVDFRQYNGETVAVFTITAGEDQLISLTNLKATGKLNFAITTTDHAGNISGTVQKVDGVDTPWVVGLYKNGQQVSSVEADDEGKYTFTAVPVGTYDVKVCGNTGENIAELYSSSVKSVVVERNKTASVDPIVLTRDSGEVRITVNPVAADSSAAQTVVPMAARTVVPTAQTAEQKWTFTIEVRSFRTEVTATVTDQPKTVVVTVPLGEVKITAKTEINGVLVQTTTHTQTVTKDTPAEATFSYTPTGEGGGNNGGGNTDPVESTLPTNAFDLVEAMGVGWNMGNTYDAPGDFNWHNGEANEALIDALYNAGFRTIRLPVTWSTHNTDAYLNYVEKVVKWVMKYDDMYIVINSHHDNTQDGYGLYTSEGADNLAKAKNFLTTTWTKIATRFADYDNRVIFETMNEVRTAHGSDDNIEHEWNPQNTCEACKAEIRKVNQLNQAALDAIRAVPGNEDRFVVIVPFAAKALGASNDAFVMPTDTVQNRLLLSVHEYTPADFCIYAKGDSFTEDIKTAIDAEIKKMTDLRDKFDVPIFIGETGITNLFDGATNIRLAWTNYYFDKVYNDNTGIMACWWDNGDAGAGTGQESFKILNRGDGSYYGDGAALVNAMLNPQ